MTDRLPAATAEASLIGVVPPNRWLHIERIDEAGRLDVRREPVPVATVTVRSVGAPLPPFVVPTPTGTGNIELLLLHGAADVPAWGADCERSPGNGLRYRFTIHDRPLVPPEPAAPPGSDVRIAVPAASQDVVAEALALLLAGRLMICVDTADVLWVTRAKRQAGGEGRAFVSEGVVGQRQAIDLQAAMNVFRREGYDGSILLMQLATAEDEESFSLAALDAVATRVIADRDHQAHIVSACLEASRSAMVAIAFEPRRRHSGARQAASPVKREPF